MYEIFVETGFSSAHRLDGYPGDCARVHGHNWRVRAAVSCRDLDERGFAVDFRELKARLEEICAVLGHRDLNRVEGLEGVNPTAENLARHIFRELARRLDDGRVRVSRVEVRETPESWAVYREPGDA